MKITINIEKRYAYVIIGLLVLATGFFIVNAFGGSQPTIMGHSWGEIECADCITGGNIATDAVGADELIASGVLQDLLTVDGTNSGLDADKLDGYDIGGIQIWNCRCECCGLLGCSTTGYYLTNANRNGENCAPQYGWCNMGEFADCQFLGYILS